MTTYVLRRLVQALPLLLGITVVSFAILKAIPGGPMAAYEGNPNITDEDIRRLEHDLGLDQPVYVQYVNWLLAFVTGDWGYSYASHRAVLTSILERLPNTVYLMGTVYVVTLLIAVPIGVAFAIGIDRWRGRTSSAFNFQMLLSFVMPELIIGVTLLFVFTTLLTAVRLGTTAQLLGLVTFQMSYPVIIVRARLLSIGKEYEEAAMDLGASPTESVRRVLLPMLAPAIFASAVLVFADVIDDFIIVRYLSSDASTEPMAVKIFNSARSSPTPALNALATIMLVSSLLVVLVGFLAYRRMTRGERQRIGMGDIAAQI